MTGDTVKNHIFAGQTSVLMTRFFFFLFFLLSPFFIVAQQKELLVKRTDNELFLEHKVAPKESFYAIGRLYNVHPRTLASYNKLNMNKGLHIDQKLKVPLSDSNFTQQGGQGAPVYYRIVEKEDLSDVSKKNRNVSLSLLRWWNHLETDEVKKDSKLIIGFIVGSQLKPVTIEGSPSDSEPVVSKPEQKETAEADLTRKEEKKVAEEEEKAEKKEEKIQQKDSLAPAVTETRKLTLDGQGYFKKHFEMQSRLYPPSKDETVTAGIFKTISGWDDGKYYLLIDKIQPGTIIVIMNPSNNKTIYAKVLGEMSGIRQNEGYNIRISNAAAAALEISDQDKFVVKLRY